MTDDLQEIIEDFPGEADLSAQLIALTERQALQLLAEAEFRAAAGQNQLARDILNRFPVIRRPRDQAAGERRAGEAE